MVTDHGLWCELNHAGCTEYAETSFRDGGLTLDACLSCYGD